WRRSPAVGCWTRPHPNVRAQVVGCHAIGTPFVGDATLGRRKLGYPTTLRSMSGQPDLHRPIHPVRLVTAASLFDGHDAAINVMRRILQAQGAEVIHLGHNRSVDEIVRAAVQEDVQGVAVSSYQGGHVEYFR